MNDFYTEDMQIEDLESEVDTLLNDIETLQADKDKLIKILEGMWIELFSDYTTPTAKEWMKKIIRFYCQG